MIFWIWSDCQGDSSGQHSINIEKKNTLRNHCPSSKWEDQYLFFVTKNGIVKRSDVSAYANIGIMVLIALNMREDDELINV